MRILLLLMFFLFLFPDSVLAALSLTLTGIPGEIDPDQEFTGNVSLSCTNCSDSYLRGAFFSSGATNYFGYTQNDNGDWVNASNPKTIYYHLAPVESSWSGQLKFRFDKEKAPGNYQFKVMRYTGSGSKSGETNSFSINVKSLVTPTPTTGPTQSPTTTLTDASTSSPTPTTKPAATFTPTLKAITPTATVASEVLAASATAVATDSFLPEEDVISPPPVLEVAENHEFGPLTFGGIAVTTLSLLSLAFWRLRRLTGLDKLK